MKYIPLGKTGIPLLSYRDHPEIITEDTEWFSEAVEQGYGVGLYLDGSGVVVVDCDSTIKHGPKITEEFGWRNFKNLCQDLGLPSIPRTFTVETKTPGHYHFYFKQNPDWELTRSSIHSQVPCVDIKVTGYVKSWHCQGYRVARNEKVVMLPTEIAKYLHRPPVRVTGADTDGRALTDDFAEYMLDKLSEAANGSRNMELFKTAAVFRDAGLTDPLVKSRLTSAAIRAGLSLHEATRTIDSAWEVRDA